MLQAASFLVELLCHAPKDRSTDDLFDVVSRDPALVDDCENLADTSDTLVTNSIRTLDVFQRALSLIPPNQRDGVFPDRLNQTDDWVHMIEQAGFEVSSNVASVACLAAKTTRSILAPMLVALAPELPEIADETNDDVLPTQWYRGIPTWACGQHTRVGLAGLRAYAARSQRVTKLVRDGKTGEISTAKILGGLLFRIECGQLRRRIVWNLGTDLKNRATGLGWGVRDDFVTNLLDTMVGEWDLLNECRLAVLQDYFR